MKYKYLLIFGVGLVIGWGILSFAANGKLSAATCTGPVYGRDWGCGYFQGNVATSLNWVFLPMESSNATLPNYAGLSGLGTPQIGDCAVSCNDVTEQSFIDVYQARLYDTNQIDAGRAAASIEIMFGLPGTKFPTIQSGINWARANFNGVTADNPEGISWVQLINIYANNEIPGYSVDWDHIVDFTTIHTNGMGIKDVLSPGSDNACEIWKECEGNIAFTNMYNDIGLDGATRFFVNGDHFDIKHKCANLTGDTGSLLIPKNLLPKLKPTVTATVNGKPGSIANVGDTVQFTYSVTNPLDSTSASTTCLIYANNLTGYHDDPPPYDTSPATGDSSGTGCPRTFPGDATVTLKTTSGTATKDHTLCGTLVVNSTGNPADDIMAEACVPTVSLICTGGQPTPTPDPKTKFSIPMQFSFEPDTPATEAIMKTDKVFIHFTGPGGFSYNPADAPFPGGASPVTYTASNIGPTGDTGSASGSYGLVDASGDLVVTCPINFSVADLPYFNVASGDVEAGDCMETSNDTTTSGDDDGSVVGWNQEANSYAGAGTQYAAFALGYLQDFATGQGSTNAASGLAFSNTNNISPGTDSGSDTYGGGYGSETPCVPDYYGTPTSVEPDGFDVNLGLPLKLEPGTSKASHQIIYVNGNAYINSNITYDQASPYTSVNDIPSFALIVKGNIYISPNVTELDGLYVAEPSGSGSALTGGTIYTCITVPDTDIQNGDLHLQVNDDTTANGYYQACKQPLTVTGSFVANQVELLRTGGTLYDSSSTPAEKFQYNPEVWLTTPAIGGSAGTNGSDAYDAITDLPPSL